jgi:hypothetical protein
VSQVHETVDWWHSQVHDVPVGGTDNGRGGASRERERCGASTIVRESQREEGNEAKQRGCSPEHVQRHKGDATAVARTRRDSGGM